MILDNACGSSALVTSHLIDVLSNARATGENLASDDDLEEEEDDNLMMDTQILASDLSQKVVSQATRRIAELDWADHVFTFKMNQEVSRASFRPLFVVDLATICVLTLSKSYCCSICLGWEMVI